MYAKLVNGYTCARQDNRMCMCWCGCVSVCFKTFLYSACKALVYIILWFNGMDVVNM